MWLYTIDAGDPPLAVDVRFEDQDRLVAEASYRNAVATRSEAKPRNYRKMPDDYVPIEERNASPELFPDGITCRSQMPER
jgi:hypothetical protein